MPPRKHRRASLITNAPVPEDPLRDFRNACYESGGDVPLAAAMCGLTVKEAYELVRKPGMQEVAGMVRSLENMTLDAGLTRTLNKALDKLQDRIDNGDVKINISTGQVFRQPMSGKDTAIAMAILYDKRQLLRQLPTVIGTGDTAEEKLERMAARLEEAVHGMRVVSEQGPDNSGIEDAQVVEEPDMKDLL